MQSDPVANILTLQPLGELVVVLPGFVLLFLAHHFLTRSHAYARLIRTIAPRCLPDACAVAVRRIAFAVVVGAVPGILLIRCSEVTAPWISPAGLLGPESFRWTVSIVALMSALSIALHRSPAAWHNYPQIRSPAWRPATHVLNVATWIPYLFACEFAYRGYLLFPLVEHIGISGAIAVSTSLYAALHITRGPAESLGCVPVGALLAIASLHTGTIWVPYVAHLGAAVLNDLLTFHANPSFRTVRRQEPLEEVHDENGDLLA